MNTKLALLVLAFLVFLSAHTADAQQPAKVYHIGVLSPRAGISLAAASTYLARENANVLP